MRRLILIAALAVAAPLGVGAGSALAQLTDQSVIFGRRSVDQAPWCGHQAGSESVEEDCSFYSFEQCRQAIMSLNSAFCTPNPVYDVNVQVVRRKKGNRLPR